MAAPYRILAIGASLTEGYTAGGRRFHPYTLRLQELLGEAFAGNSFEVVNRGVSGETSEAILKRLHSELHAEIKFDAVVILAGVNDVGLDIPTPQITANIQAMCVLVNATSPGAMVFVCTLPQCAYESRSDAATDDERERVAYTRAKDRVNEYINSLPTAHTDVSNVVVVDLYSSIPHLELPTKLRKELWDDGLHLTADGYDKMAHVIYENMRPWVDKWAHDKA